MNTPPPIFQQYTGNRANGSASASSFHLTPCRTLDCPDKKQELFYTPTWLKLFTLESPKQLESPCRDRCRTDGTTPRLAHTREKTLALESIQFVVRVDHNWTTAVRTSTKHQIIIWFSSVLLA